MTAADPPAGAFEAAHARVLVVEDDQFDREYLVHILSTDFEILEAVDGTTALELIDQEEVDVVLVDHGLPGMTGARLLRECQDRSPVTSRILLSGILNLDTVLRSVNDGHIFAALNKPVDSNTLLTTVHNAARACRMIRERSLLIGELANANAQIYDEQQRLVALNSELRMLVTIATHDLREPLRSTRFFLDKCIHLLADHSDPMLTVHLERVRRAHDRMDQLLHGLREWLRLQTQEFQLAQVDMGVVVQEVLDNLIRLLSERGARVQRPEQWPVVEANAPLLRSVFENLITNAVRFSPDGEPQITLAWQREGDMIRVEVSDEGLGIEPAYHYQVFGMFKRLESRRHFEGTGAGLAISQKVIQRHGGHIGVESERGKGSTFWFTVRPSLAEAELTV